MTFSSEVIPVRLKKTRQNKILNSERMPTMTVTIYHNPSCSKSRNTLAMIRQSGEEPVVIEYLKHPPDRARLRALAEAMGLSIRGLLRDNGSPYGELDLGNPKWSDDQLLDFIVAHPILLQRPIVETPNGVRICRPPERVLDLLTPPAAGKDGENIEP